MSRVCLGPETKLSVTTLSPNDFYEYATFLQALEEDLEAAKGALAKAETATAEAVAAAQASREQLEQATAAAEAKQTQWLSSAMDDDADRAASPGGAVLWQAERSRLRHGLREQELELQRRQTALEQLNRQLDASKDSIAFLEDALSSELRVCMRTHRNPLQTCAHLALPVRDWWAVQRWGTFSRASQGTGAIHGHSCLCARSQHCRLRLPRRAAQGCRGRVARGS